MLLNEGPVWGAASRNGNGEDGRETDMRGRKRGDDAQAATRHLRV
jgi:hypothetical protein